MPEFTRLVSFFIVTNHDSFQYFKAMFLGFLSMAVENFQCARYSLVPAIGPIMVGPEEKIFQIKVLRRLENAILRLVFVDAVLHKIAILLILYAGFTENVPDIASYLESTIGPTMVGSGQKNSK